MKRLIEQTGCQHGYWDTCVEYPKLCPGGSSRDIHFDAIWRRYYETANRRFEAGLTYDELKQVVLGGTG